MSVKKITAVFLVLLFPALITVSCKKMSIKSDSFSTARKSGNGKTPATAIVIDPQIELKATDQLKITVNDNIRWFYMDLKKGQSYKFETSGKGDPTLYIYYESQDDNAGGVSGEPVAIDWDSAYDNKNCVLNFRAPRSEGYYLKLILYAGSSWSGNLKYQKK